MGDWHDAESHADRALEMFERGRWADAEAELRKALSLNPDQAEWHFNLGLTLEHAGRDADAYESYLHAIELMPDEPDPMVAAGIVANRLEKYLEAIELFDRALRLNNVLEAAYAHKIESLIRLGRHDDAETTFYLAQQALTESSAACLAVMAESLMQRGLNERAEWCLKEALRLEPNMPRLRARLAAVSAAIGKPQRALQLYLRELRDDPGSIDTLLEYGLLLREQGRLPEAGEKFRRVLELEPANVDAHFELGRIALSTRRFEQATLEFELVMKLDGAFPGIRPAIGEALLCRDRIDEAREHLRDEYDSIKAMLSEGITEVGQPASAPAVSPALPPVPELAKLAQLLLAAEEPAKAAELLEAALTLEETADLLRQLALARFRAGDRDGGTAASRRVLRLDPNCLRSMHNLALAALEHKQPRIASGWVKRGLRINRHDDGLRRLRIRIWLAYLIQLWKQIIG